MMLARRLLMGARGGDWTPAEISGAVWIDADTVTLNGATISAATDKKAGTITASQATAANQPTLVTNVLNGEPVMQFDGNDWLSFGTALGRPSNYTVFVVGMFAAVGSSTSTLCGSMDSANSRTSWGRCSQYNGQSWYSFGNDSVHSDGYVVSAFSAGTWFMQCGRYSSGQNEQALRINGTERTVTKNTTNATANAGTAQQYSIGRFGINTTQYANNGSRLKGWVFVPTAISDDVAARLEGYYAHLCGLTSLLPSDHPYKSAAPTI